MRRIPYLVHVRNQALEPLSGLAESGVVFDKTIYINDVVFSVGSACRTGNLTKAEKLFELRLPM